jgi:hypothetical protein
MTLSLWMHVPTAAALGFIALALMLGVGASLLRSTGAVAATAPDDPQ